MLLTHLRLNDFRNLTAVAVSPHPRFNLLIGSNGQGKTNCLEAIYWLASLRPLRARRLRELVRFGAEAARVEASLSQGGLAHALAVAVEGTQRVAWREEKRVRASEYFGALAVVVFTPDDVGLIRGSPEQRRRFLDRAVFTLRPAHLGAALAYRRALDGRNRLLREGAAPGLIEAFEGTLAGAAVRLLSARRAYLEALAPRFEAVFAAIAGAGAGPGRVAYRASLEGDDEGALAEAWRADRPRDRERGFTQRGPHADDLAFLLGGRPARLYASQGQQRALVLALKIAEIEGFEAQRGEAPVLLLDDVSSELDAQRNERLFDFLEGFGGQVFITSTDRAFLRIKGEQAAWRVQAGELSAWE